MAAPTAVTLRERRMKLRRARRRRKWSYYQAAKAIGCSMQQVRNLEGIGASRATDPACVQLRTAVAILAAYAPDVTLEDMLGAAAPFELVFPMPF